jgi:hypothetical protein
MLQLAERDEALALELVEQAEDSGHTETPNAASPRTRSAR